MSNKRPYIATIFNAVIAGLLTVSKFLPKPSSENSTGLNFDTDPGIQSGVGLVFGIYTAIIFVFAIAGFFKLDAAKIASRMAIPMYGLQIIALLFIGIFYRGTELSGLSPAVKVVFVVLAAFLAWLIYVCLKTIRFEPEAELADHIDEA